MWNAVVILAVILGTIAGLLLPASRHVARTLWPGPTMKGPADVYVQAFQVLICLATLTIIPIVASGVGFCVAVAIDWHPGRWLAAIPLVALALIWTTMWMLRHR